MAAHPAPRFGFFVLVAVGILIAGAGTMFMSISFKWTAAGIVGLCAAFPALLIRPARLYGLAAYLFLLLLEPNGKRIDKLFNLRTDYLEVYGIPPGMEVAIVIRPSDLVLLLLVGAWVLGALIRRSGFQFPKLGYLYVAFLAWAALASVLKSEVIYFSVGEYILQLKFLLVFLYVASAVDTLRLAKGVIVLLLVGLFLESSVALAAFAMQYEGHPLAFLFEGVSTGNYTARYENISPIVEEGAIGRRAVGTFGNYLWVAMYLEFLVPLAFTLFWIDTRVAAKWIYAFLFFLGMGTLVATFSRAGLLSLAVGLSVCLLIVYRRGYVSRKVMMLIVYAGVMTVTIASPFVYDYLTTRPENISRRFPLMEKAAIMIAENPILGVGLNNHTAAKMRMFVPEEEGEDTNPTHNHYLALGSEVGLVGLGLQMAFFLLILRAALRRPKSREPIVQAFLVAAAGAFISLYVHLLGDNFSGNVPRSMYFLYAGLVLAFHRLDALMAERPEAAPTLTGSKVKSPRSGRSPTADLPDRA